MAVYKKKKITLLPTEEQEQQFWQYIGACRWIWNYMFDANEIRYKTENKYLSVDNMINTLPAIYQSPQFEWLNKIPTESLEVVCKELDKAYKRYTKGVASKPTFKSRKRSKPDCPLIANKISIIDNKEVYIPDIGNVACTFNDDTLTDFSGKFINPRLTRENNIWLLSFGVKY